MDAGERSGTSRWLLGASRRNEPVTGDAVPDSVPLACGVCGGRVSYASRYRALGESAPVFFCSSDCRERFLRSDSELRLARTSESLPPTVGRRRRLWLSVVLLPLACLAYVLSRGRLA